MLNFHKNTYFVNYDDRDEVINILKKYPEYKGFTADCYWDDRTFKDHYTPIWSELEHRFAEDGNVSLYLDNEYITESNIQHHSWLIGLAEVYTNEDCVQHNPQPLLPELKKIDRQLMKVE